MSYCRFSDMNWQCDLYLYESEAGWAVNVAGNRIVIPDDWPMGPEAIEAAALSGKELVAWLQQSVDAMKDQSERIINEQVERVDIPPPWGGFSQVFTDIEELMEILHEMRAEGIRFPNSVLEDLADEAKERGLA